MLLKYGADANLIDDTTGNTALHNCLLALSENIVNLLVDHGADCNALTRDGVTAIQLASVVFDTTVTSYILHKMLTSFSGCYSAF